MKKVLFSILGMSPQILTETLYALMKDNRENLPDEIHVLTTKLGADLCKRALFQENGGWFFRFCEDWKVSGIKFDEGFIHTIVDEQGEALEDIRTDSNNMLVANQIMHYVNKFTQNDDSSLHVSIAGGRKTMGFFAGYALSMYGRDQDRLSHVLVAEAFEGLPEFFYPSPVPHVIRSRDKKELLECQNAEVELAYIPFLAMRNVLSETLLSSELSYIDKVRRLQKRVFDKKVQVSVWDKTLHIGGEEIKMSTVNFVFYVWVLERVLEGKPDFINPFEGEPNKVYGESFVDCLGRMINEMEDTDRTRDVMLEEGMSYEFIRDRRNQIHKALKNALGVNADAFLLPLTDRKKRIISLGIEPSQIQFI